MRLILPAAIAVFSLSPAVPASDMVSADLKPPTVGAWDDYVRAVEDRVEKELQTTKPFLVLERLPQAEQQKAAASLKSGAVFITQVPGPTLRGPMPKIPDGLVHHWLGVVRIPGVRVDDVLAFVQRYDESPRFFKDAIASKLLQRNGDEFEVFLKLRREKLIVDVDLQHDPSGHLPAARCDARGESKRVRADRRARERGQAHRARDSRLVDDSGYLWRLNSYWRFVETAGGVTVECESHQLEPRHSGAAQLLHQRHRRRHRPRVGGGDAGVDQEGREARRLATCGWRRLVRRQSWPGSSLRARFGGPHSRPLRRPGPRLPLSGPAECRRPSRQPS